MSPRRWALKKTTAASARELLSLSLYDPAAFAEKDGPEDGSKKNDRIKSIARTTPARRSLYQESPRFSLKSVPFADRRCLKIGSTKGIDKIPSMVSSKYESNVGTNHENKTG